MSLQVFLYVGLFLFCVVFLSRVRSRIARQIAILIASYVLYSTWELWFAAILLSSTIMNFVLGGWLRRKASGLALSTGIVLNLILLAGFKYLPEAAVQFPFSSLQKFAHLALPLGISFWTFQAISYLFDLYRGEELKPTFIEFALYMAFFPITVSGPICRMPEMLPQFRSEQSTSWQQIGGGFRRIATGILMMQLARLLGQGIFSGDGINSGFDRVTNWGGADVWCLAFGYGLQLFLDFAGYSHIAIGSAHAMGLAIPENFARPFHSTTPSIFWTRWHMSLSFWIRDYVFLPMAMLRPELWWRNLALVVAMIVFGIWHKASLLLLLWGCYQGVVLVVHRQLQQAQRRFNWKLSGGVWTLLSWLSTMALINLGWILFRANSVAHARQMLEAVIAPATYGSHVLGASLYFLIAALAAGYGIVLYIGDALEHQTTKADERTASAARMIAFAARWRWFWIPPLYAVALIFLLLVTLTGGPTGAQLMYRKF